MTSPLRTEVLVVGAGPAGSTAARLLARQGRGVLLVDQAHFPRPKTCGDGLTPRAVTTLERQGLLSLLLDAGYPRIDGARMVAPDGHEWHAPFDRYARSLPSVGLTVERTELDELLRSRAEAAGVHFLSGFRARSAHRHNESVAGVEGTLSGNEQTIEADLTIVATGANVTLPRAMGVLEKAPAMVRAVRGYFEDVEGLTSEFEFHFRREIRPGYAWIFPVGGGRANVGLGLFPDSGKPAADSRPKTLLNAFLRLPDIERRFRAARLAGPLEGYPLRIDYPDHPVHGAGFLVVGEAAGLVNPITGEGIDLALESGEMAAAVAGRALQRGDVSANALRPYARSLERHFAGWFLGMRQLRPRVMTPRALNILIAKGRRWPGLGRTIVGIILGTASPWQAANPLNWLYLAL